MIQNKISGGHALKIGLGIVTLVLVLLVSSACAAPYAYITNYYSYNVSVIDTATNTFLTVS
jgi:DNA-binding beta-propeller fold protein YncE